jgi:DNA-binding beta-propeller fold protein YncE
LGFNGSIAVTSDGTHVWVANSSGNSVTELSASAGGLVRVIFGRRYGFDHPDAIAPGGTHVWVANEGDQSVTEFSAW